MNFCDIYGVCCLLIMVIGDVSCRDVAFVSLYMTDLIFSTRSLHQCLPWKQFSLMHSVTLATDRVSFLIMVAGDVSFI